MIMNRRRSIIENVSSGSAYLSTKQFGNYDKIFTVKCLASGGNVECKKELSIFDIVDLFLSVIGF